MSRTRISRILSFGLVLLVTVATSEAQQARNGAAWKQMSESLKLGYVMGFIDAAAWASQNVDGALYVLKSMSPEDRKLVAKGKDVWNYQNISYGQLVEGLNAFYGDYRNEAIKWDRGISYVRDEIHGDSKEFLEKELEFERKIAASDSTK